MFQCPQCDHRVFEAGMRVCSRVRLTGLDDGDYREEEIDSYARDWDTLTCCRCGYACDEEEAKECFEVATRNGCVTHDLYEWVNAQICAMTRRGIDTSGRHPEVESMQSIADGWNLWDWRQA